MKRYHYWDYDPETGEIDFREAETGDWCKWAEVAPELLALRAVAEAAEGLSNDEEWDVDMHMPKIRAALARWKEVRDAGQTNG